MVDRTSDTSDTCDAHGGVAIVKAWPPLLVGMVASADSGRLRR